MRYKILIVEDNGKRINTFIESLGQHELDVVDSIQEAKLALLGCKYDYLFLPNKVGVAREHCISLIHFIVDELAYHPFIISHTLDLISVESFKEVIPEISWKPFGSDEFFSMSLIKER